MSFFPFVPKNHVPRTHLKCSKCGHLLPVSQFYEDPDRPVWLRSHWSSRCRSCVKAVALARYQVDPKAAAARRKRNRAAQRANAQALAHIPEASLRASAERRRADKIRRLTKSFHHSLHLHANPYPKGYPHSFSARAALDRIRSSGPAAAVPAGLRRPLVAPWAKESLTPSEAIAKLRAMHRAQQDAD